MLGEMKVSVRSKDVKVLIEFESCKEFVRRNARYSIELSCKENLGEM